MGVFHLNVKYLFKDICVEKMPQSGIMQGAVCNSGMGMLFLIYLIWGYKISTISYTKAVIRLLTEMKLILIHYVQDLYFMHSVTHTIPFKLNLNCNGIMLKFKKS